MAAAVGLAEAEAEFATTLKAAQADPLAAQAAPLAAPAAHQVAAAAMSPASRDIKLGADGLATGVATAATSNSIPLSDAIDPELRKKQTAPATIAPAIAPARNIHSAAAQAVQSGVLRKLSQAHNSSADIVDEFRRVAIDILCQCDGSGAAGVRVNQMLESRREPTDTGVGAEIIAMLARSSWKCWQ